MADEATPTTRWIEDTTVEAPEGHIWVRPAPDACPNCPCCSKRLCEMAIEQDSCCHWLGNSSDYDLSQCPCWRAANDRRAAEEEG